MKTRHKTAMLPTRKRATGRGFLSAALSVAAIVSTVVATGALANAENWLRFRGPDGAGVAAQGTKLPVDFDDNKHMQWKTELPGAGASAPIVVDDRLFLTCYSGYGEDRDNPGDMKQLMRHVVCVDKADGKKLWQKELAPHLPEDTFSGMGIPEHGYSSSTPVSDGQHVYVFLGKSGVYAFDFEGNQVWHTSVGTGSGDRGWGSGASPVLSGDILIINASDESNAIVGLDKHSGKELWRNEDVANVWSTPLVVGEGDDAAVILSLPYDLWALEPVTGKLKWYTTNGVQDTSVSASPMLNGDVVIAMGGRSNTAIAVRIGGEKGADVTKTNTLWQGKSVARIMTPVLYDGYIFGLSRGILTCVDASTGKEVYRERIPSNLLPKKAGGRRGPSADYASPVVADGKIYQFLKDGTCLIVEASPDFKMVGAVKLAEDGSEFNATPAIADNRMFVRSNRYLYCIGL